MKTLYLIRHAKSSWDDQDQTDFDRPLNKRGKHDAPLMADILKMKSVEPDLIISSPANRALSTAIIFAEILEYDLNTITTDERIYEAGIKELITLVREIDDMNNTVIIFGHNPGFTSFTNLLGDKYIPDMPTCSIVGLELGVAQWDQAERHCGKIFLFEYPKKQIIN
ncbi:MAG: histidine phosphatase family protein [Ignavibacteriales bacterium]|nr:histidine phosphatase family protein [Ignavibacteriales bacterium]